MIFDFTTLRHFLLRCRSSDYSLERWDYVVEFRCSLKRWDYVVGVQMLFGALGYVVVSVVDLGVRI